MKIAICIHHISKAIRLMYSLLIMQQKIIEQNNYDCCKKNWWISSGIVANDRPNDKHVKYWMCISWALQYIMVISYCILPAKFHSHHIAFYQPNFTAIILHFTSQISQPSYCILPAIWQRKN